MPNIRDFTSALRQRPGVDAVLVLGKDGLLIEGFAAPGLNTEDLAARVPALVSEAESLGRSTQQGPVNTAILEHQKGYAIIAALADETHLRNLRRQPRDLRGVRAEYGFWRETASVGRVDCKSRRSCRIHV